MIIGAAARYPFVAGPAGVGAPLGLLHRILRTQAFPRALRMRDVPRFFGRWRSLSVVCSPDAAPRRQCSRCQAAHHPRHASQPGLSLTHGTPSITLCSSGRAGSLPRRCARDPAAACLRGSVRGRCAVHFAAPAGDLRFVWMTTPRRVGRTHSARASCVQGGWGERSAPPAPRGADGRRSAGRSYSTRSSVLMLTWGQPMRPGRPSMRGKKSSITTCRYCKRTLGRPCESFSASS